MSAVYVLSLLALLLAGTSLGFRRLVWVRRLAVGYLSAVGRVFGWTTLQAVGTNTLPHRFLAERPVHLEHSKLQPRWKAKCGV